MESSKVNTPAPVHEHAVDIADSDNAYMTAQLHSNDFQYG